MIILEDEYFEENLLTLSELKANNAYVFVISDCIEELPLDKIDSYIEIPSLGVYTGILSILPL